MTKGVSYSVTPTTTILVNDTITNFSLDLSSTFWVVSSFGFNLKDENGTTVSTQTLSDNGGFVSVNYSTGNNANITMDGFWIIEGNQTDFSRTWIVYDESLDSDLSIKQFFTDLKTYIDSGIFGLDNFGLAIILFLFIFGFTGIMSWKFGLTSPATITAILFSLVLFFDVGLGLFDNLNPVGAVQNFPTIFVGIILIGVIIKEATR